MQKRILLAILAVFVTWQILDFVIHGLLLTKTYEATADLWRPMEEMKRGLMMLVSLVASTTFVCLYAWLARPKALVTGLIYGILFGLGTGFSMGYGTYSFMPIPNHLALTWFLGTLVETTVAGLLVGCIVKETISPAPESVSA